MADPKPVVAGLLDDLLDPATRALVQSKRRERASHDLSSLITPKPKPPETEILPPTTVYFHEQINTCSCGARVSLPLGLESMHPFKRNGRRAEGLVGIPLAEPNDFPHLARERIQAHSHSKVCSACVDDVRFAPKQPHVLSAPLPVRSEEWYKQLGCCTAESLREYEEKLRHAEERERLAEGKDTSFLTPLRELAQNISAESDFGGMKESE